MEEVVVEVLRIERGDMEVGENALQSVECHPILQGDDLVAILQCFA